MKVWKRAATAAAMAGMALTVLPVLAATAAVPIVPYGAIGAEWNAKGGAGGFLGAPQDNEYTVSAIPGDQVPPGARAEDFTGGVIYWSPATGAHEAHGAILQEYVAVGGTAVYGLPLTDEVTAPDGVGRFNHFSAGGSIYWTPLGGAHAVHGGIKADWVALGYEHSVVGYPTSDEYDVPGVPGARMQYFAGGDIFWSGPTGAHEVHGLILFEYANTLGGAQTYGLPTTDETTAPDRVGRFNHFQGGSIYWTPVTGAHEVHGAIREAWAGTGYEHGPLGYPTTDEFGMAGGRGGDFQHGYIWWTATGGTVVHVN